MVFTRIRKHIQNTILFLKWKRRNLSSSWLLVLSNQRLTFSELLFSIITSYLFFVDRIVQATQLRQILLFAERHPLTHPHRALENVRGRFERLSLLGRNALRSSRLGMSQLFSFVQRIRQSHCQNRRFRLS
jgi:hypothetical protein